MTLRSITDDIAYRLGDLFNAVLKQSIEDSIIDYRALLIRRLLERDNADFQHFIDSFKVDMKLTKTANGSQLLVSTEPLPKAIRIKGWGRSPYRYVGSIDRMIPYTYAVPDEANYYSNLPFQEKNVYYSLYDRNLQILNRNKNCQVLVEGVIVDPREIKDCTKPNLLPDQIDFACPPDFIADIKNYISKQYNINLTQDGKETNLEKDAQD